MPLEILIKFRIGIYPFSFASYAWKQMFDLSNEKNRIRRCDVLRCVDMLILKYLLQALVLVSSLNSFELLVYISFANFRSKQMFGISEEKTRIRRCDVLRCDDRVHFKMFAASSGFSFISQFFQACFPFAPRPHFPAAHRFSAAPRPPSLPCRPSA